MRRGTNQSVVGIQQGSNVTLSWSDNTLSWYSGNVYNQNNNDGTLYHYTAIGQ